MTFWSININTFFNENIYVNHIDDRRTNYLLKGCL